MNDTESHPRSLEARDSESHFQAMKYFGMHLLIFLQLSPRHRRSVITLNSHQSKVLATKTPVVRLIGHRPSLRFSPFMTLKMVVICYSGIPNSDQTQDKREEGCLLDSSERLIRPPHILYSSRWSTKPTLL
jgi:hypothetical protein